MFRSLLILTAGACAREPAPAPPSEETPMADPGPNRETRDEGPKPERFAEAALPGDPTYTGRTVAVSSKEPAPELHPGDRVTWTISSTSSSVDPRYRTQWSTPEARGDGALRYLFTHYPPGLPGSDDIAEHWFLAVAPGAATLGSFGTPGDRGGAEPGPGDLQFLEVAVAVVAP
ncbi:MAG: hypothetical protein H6737_23655 [Alphaproteobacteria bacterium]|nr:hypothetical protein [Alphaproteobacteria bacterium]